MTDTLKQELLAAASEIKTVDCHAHTRFEKTYYEEQKQGPFHLFGLSAYFQRDVANMLGEKTYAELGADTDEQKWEIFKQCLEQGRNVSYYRHNIVMYKALFGLEEDELTDDNWQAVNAAIKEKTADSDWYRHVTEDLCNLEIQVRNISWFENWEKQYFTGILRMEGAATDGFLARDAYDRLAIHTKREIISLESALDAIEALMRMYIDKGIRGIKLGHAYNRTLYSEPVSKFRAEELFERYLKQGKLEGDELLQMQDFMIFHMAELCKYHNLVFQIHTGCQTNWGTIPDSNPLHLIPLLTAFPEVRFDLFHAGYPFSREIGMLGKHYPNVYLNMAWMYVISTAASRQILAEWFDLVPGNRILAFGSDVGFPEFIYAHLLMARDCMADVLAEKVAKDYLSRTEAFSLVQRTFRDNGLELYRL